MTLSIPPSDAEQRLRSLVDRLGAIVWEAVPGRGPGAGAFTFVSEGTEALLGYPRSRWTEDPAFWLEITHPDDRDRLRAAIAEAVSDGAGADVEYRCRSADGRTLWVRVIATPDVRKDGQPVLRGLIVDVTARRAAHERLQRLQTLTDALSGLMDAREVAAVVASQGRAATGADAVAVFLRDGDDLELSGYDGYAEESIEEFCRIPLARDVPAAEAVRTGEAIILDADAFDARYPGMRSWRKLAGRGQFVALPLTSDGEVLGAVALRMPGDRPLEEADRLVLDVLTRSCAGALQRAHHVTAEREASMLLDAIITTAPEGFALLDTDLRYVRVNDALAEMNGVPAADHIGHTLGEIVPDLPSASLEAPLRRVLESAQPVLDVEITGSTPADPARPHTWLASYYPVFGVGGRVAWLGAFVLDITSRKRAEQRAGVLAELGSILDEVIGVEDRLARLVDAVVPALADACTVSLRGPGGDLERVALRHVAPEAERVLAEFATPRANVATTHVVQQTDASTYEAYGLGAEDEERRAHLQLRSGVTAPMVVRGRHVGVLALGSRREHAFGPDEVELAEELARRAALAVDNAQLYASERRARERTARQYAVASALADALTPADVAQAILAEVVSALDADSGTVWQVSEEGRHVDRIGARGFNAAMLSGHERYAIGDDRPVADAIRHQRPLWLRTPEELDAAYPQWAAGFRAIGLASAAVFPLISGGRAVGGLWLSSNRPRAFDTEDRALASALAAQAAQALERARLFEAERRVSVTLQRSLLPAHLPEVEGVEVAVRYVPAAGLEAGGDFYEALPLPGGAIGLAVGDVVGRGAAAAAAMGQLRSALRAFALVGEEPAAVLGHLSAFADTVGGAMAATAIVARLQPDTGELRYACAGHPWPLLVHADGRTEFLLGGRGVPLGCLADPAFEEAVAHLEPGATVLLYTDGLTERRDEDLDEVLERLRDAAGAAAADPVGDLLDRALRAAGAHAPADDVALVAVRRSADAARTARPAPLRRRFPTQTEEVPAARTAMRRWLERLGVDRATAGDLLLAAGEAVANAVEHSGSETVQLEVSAPQAGVVEVAVLDDGRWKPQVFAAHRGRGFDLMRSLVDDLAVERRPGGSTVRMRRRFDAPERPEPAEPGPDGGGCELELRGAVAHVRGELDLACSADIRDQLLAALPATVDLTEVSFLDSTGARLLLELAELRDGGLVVIAPPGAPGRRALELSGIAALVDLRDA